MPAIGYALLRALTALYSRVDLNAHQALRAASGCVEGALSAALTREERSDLTVHLFGLRSRRPSQASLRDWERAWYSEALPAAPARLLLGAAGDGREASWLCDAGYRVDAFEPSPQLASLLHERVGTRARTLRASYEDVVAAVVRGGDSPFAPWAMARYDAIILGWGSLTHVLDPEHRRDLLRACDLLAPAGPILASFWTRPEGAPEARSRARAIGSAVGRRLAALRGVSVAESGGAGELFRTHLGFAYRFTRGEIEALAAANARTAIWREGSYPHVTFVKCRDRR